jgi:hypothetical protein
MPLKTDPPYEFPYPLPEERAEAPRDIRLLAERMHTVLKTFGGSRGQVELTEQFTVGPNKDWFYDPPGSQGVVQVAVRLGAAKTLLVAVSAVMSADDIGAFGYLGYTVKNGANKAVLVAPSGNRAAYLNGVGSSLSVSVARFHVHTFSSLPPGNSILVSPAYANTGTRGSVRFDNVCVVADGTGFA